MSRPRGEVFLGDLLRALDEVGAQDRATVESVAAMLGFQLGAEGPAAAGAQAPARTPLGPRMGGWQRSDTPSTPAPGHGKLLPVTRDPRRKYPLVDYEAVEGNEPEPEFEHRRESAATSRSVPAKADWPEWAGTASPGFPRESLFLRRWTRGIISEALSTMREGGDPDVGRVLEVFARGAELERVPMLRVPTLAHGCQVLCDVSTAMMPFIDDRLELLEDIASLVGRELVEVLYFDDCPIYGVEREGAFEFGAYEPPPPGTPVVIVSDLGIADSLFSLRRSSPDEWMELLDLLRGREHRVLAFTPYPPARWPPLLAEHLQIVQWDCSTTAATVRHVRERG